MNRASYITRLHLTERILRVGGWVVAILLVIIGYAAADPHEPVADLVRRAIVAAAVLAITHAAAWTVERHAARAIRGRTA